MASVPQASVSAAARRPGLLDFRAKLSDKVGEPVLRGLSLLAGLLSIVLIVWIVETVFDQAGPAISKYGLSFIWRQEWNPNAGSEGSFGALTFIYGTLVSSFVALLLATPAALAISIFLTELAPRVIRRPTAILVELLAAIPSVILGLWGIIILGPFLGNHLEPFLQSFLGWIPLFAGPTSPYGMLNAALILTIMALPIITSVTREVFETTPADLKEGAYALGATRWEMVRMTVLPIGRAGVTGAVILGLGRAFGEAIAVTQVIGNASQIKASLFQPAGTLAAQIANDYQSANPGLNIASLMYLGVILMVISLVVNIIARVIVRQTGTRVAAA
jgi:phosphate transport system permease protein